MSHQLEVGERVDENRVLRNAGDPQCLAVRVDADPVRGGIEAAGIHVDAGVEVGQLDPGHLLVLGEVQRGEPVERGQLHEDPLGRAVRIGLDGHRTNPKIELVIPDDRLGLRIDDRHELLLHRAADDILLVGRHIDVVQATAHRDALG